MDRCGCNVLHYAASFNRYNFHHQPNASRKHDVDTNLPPEENNLRTPAHSPGALTAPNLV